MIQKVTAVVVDDQATAGTRLCRLRELTPGLASGSLQDFAEQLAVAAVDSVSEPAVVAEIRGVLLDVLNGDRADLPDELVGPVTNFLDVPADYFTDADLAARVDIELLNAALSGRGVEDVFLCRGGELSPTAEANGLAFALQLLINDDSLPAQGS